MRPDTDACVWASSIGATTIDIRDRAVMPTRLLKAPLIKTEKLAELRKLLSKGADLRDADIVISGARWQGEVVTSDSLTKADIAKLLAPSLEGVEP